MGFAGDAGPSPCRAYVVLSRTLYGRWLVRHRPQRPDRPHLRSAGAAGHVPGLYRLRSLRGGGIGSLHRPSRNRVAGHGQRILLDVIGATVIGGTSLFGGKGKILWTIFGVLFLALIDNSLNLLNISYFTIMMVKGGVILLAAVMDSLRNQLVAR